MRSFFVVVLGIILLTAPHQTWALDEETQRLEQAVLCEAMPYHCQAPVTPQAPRPIPRLAPPKAKKPATAPAQAASPPVVAPAPPPRSASSDPALDADGWPRPKTAVESLVTECARASGVDPRSNLTMQQLRAMTTCIDLVRAALARMK